MSLGPIALPVSSAPDVITTMVGWAIYDGVWGVMAQTALIWLPFIALLLTVWSGARERLGDSDGVRVALLMLETRGAWMFVVLALAGMPLLEVNIGSLALHRQLCTGDVDSTRSSEVTHGDATGTSWDERITTLGDQTVKVPVWWAFVYALSAGLNNAAIASIPCTSDIRATAYQLNSNPVSRDGQLTRDLADFTGDCFREAAGQASNDLGSGRLTLSDEQRQDLGWLGASILIERYYPTLFAQRSVVGFTPAGRSSELFYAAANDGIPPEVGRPSCSEWWQGQGGPGLRQRVIDHINQTDPDLLSKARGALCFGGSFGFCSDTTSAENQIIRSLLERDDATLSHLARSAPGAVRHHLSAAVGEIAYLGLSDYNGDRSGERISEFVGVLGSLWDKATFYPTVVMARAAALPLQAIAVAVIIVALPFILLFSSFSMQALFTVSFGLFAVKTWTVIWAFARYLDDNLLIALRAQGVMLGSAEYLDLRSHAIDFITGALFLIAPLLWSSLLAWAGWKIGGVAGEYVRPVGQHTASAASAGGTAMRGGAAGMLRRK